jgi:hypothetical protein
MQKPNVMRRLTWRNPLSSVSPRPYLNSPIFPKDQSSVEYQKARDVLWRFYTSDRDGEDDARKLIDFILNPEKQCFVIWGDIGIGKSWFVRYQLESLKESSTQVFYHGIVDMLRASIQDARSQLEGQMTLVLESYFRDTLSGLKKGLQTFADNRAGILYLDHASEEFRAEANSIREKIIVSTGSERLQFLLDAIECAPGPPLFVAIDNIDRAIGADQNLIADLVARRLHNSKIYLIFSLRSSSRILLDHDEILGFFEKSEMHLSSVRFPSMLRPRFANARDGEELLALRLPTGARDEEPCTFTELLESFLASEAGEFVLDLAGTNSRKLLDFISRILFSNHLASSVRNIRDPEACIAALLMLDQPKFDPELSYILNLFDNGEPSSPGNSLIRFRVQEYLRQAGEVSFQERHCVNYFNSLGYSLERVKEVLATFVGVGLAQTNPPRTAENIRQKQLSEIGSVNLTAGTAAQYDKLLKSPWYFISVKNDTFVPDNLIKTDEFGYEYVKNSDFIDFIKNEEDQERRRSVEWVKRNGKQMTFIQTSQPWALARAALSKKSTKTASVSANLR